MDSRLRGNDEYVWDPSGGLVKFGQVTDRLVEPDVAQEAPSD